MIVAEMPPVASCRLAEGREVRGVLVGLGQVGHDILAVRIGAREVLVPQVCEARLAPMVGQSVAMLLLDGAVHVRRLAA